MDTLIIVEGNHQERRQLKSSLETESFIVFEAAVARRLLEIVQNHHVDLILLNYGLPDGDAIDFLKSIRDYTDAPLIITSSAADARQKITSLNMRADDFIMKPYDVDELIARIKASLRRCTPLIQDNHQPVHPACFAHKVSFGDLIFDRPRMQVFNTCGHSLHLTYAEFRLLEIFIERPETVLSRTDICEKLSQVCRHTIHESSINIKIMRLRRKIAEHSTHHDMLRTIREVGYMLDTPLTVIS